MSTVELSEAEKLVRSIRDGNNPAAASDGLKLRDKWLLENDLGLLQLSPDVKHVLETALEL
jgi:hypothetical protein